MHAPVVQVSGKFCSITPIFIFFWTEEVWAGAAMNGSDWLKVVAVGSSWFGATCHAILCEQQATQT